MARTRVIALVGTKKGAFLVESDENRRTWELRGPFCNGSPVLDMSYDPATRTIYAAAGNEWYGSEIWRTRDFGESWTHSGTGLNYGEGGPKLIKLWNVTPAHGSVYVGAEPAGLFRSDDGGDSFTHVEGLRNHPTCPEWQPGNGGLCLHTILPHPTDPQKMWVAASAVGTFFTADGGKSWSAMNRGLRADYLPEEKRPEVGWCVHKAVLAAGQPDLMYQQNHQGVYRSRDGGNQWEWINEGLPSTFGFPIVAHPRDPNTIYVIPLNGDSVGRFMPEARTAVWRSRNGGDSWEKLTRGLPQGAYVNVLREAMAIDDLPRAGIYFGTGTGQIFCSPDEGESWLQVADYLPPVYGVGVAVVTD